MSEVNWYVVHTYSGYENKVKANIEKTIENRHLEDQILEVRVPMEEVVEVKNGTKKQVLRKLFPGYVLINMIMNDDTWYVVRNTRGVTGFVGPGSKPVPLTDEEMVNLGITGGEEKVELDLEVGDAVVVTGGAWKDTTGLIQSINDTKQCAGFNKNLLCHNTISSISKTTAIPVAVILNFSEHPYYTTSRTARQVNPKILPVILQKIYIRFQWIRESVRFVPLR